MTTTHSPSSPRRMTRAGIAALMLLAGTWATAGPAAAKDGADDGPSPSASASAPDDSATRASSPGTTGTTARSRVRVSGSCSASASSKLTAKSRDGRLEVEFEVDSNRRGQRWTYTLRHDGSVTASGRRVTAGRSGSWSVERGMPDVAGTHQVSATARNARTGESCRASLTI